MPLWYDKVNNLICIFGFLEREWKVDKIRKKQPYYLQAYLNYTKKTLNKAYLSDSTKNAILGQMMKGKPE